MAVVSVTEVKDNRRASRELDKAKRTYVRTFQVRTNDPLDDGGVVRETGSLPAIGSQYITVHWMDTGAILKSKEAQQSNEDPLVWTVTCNYDSEVPDPAQAVENPLLRPIKWKFSFVKEQVAVQNDLDGDPVVNSAGQPFLPPVEVPVSRPLITAELNKAFFNFAFVGTVVDCVNSQIWYGFPIGTVKIDSIETESEYENGLAYWKQVWTFSIRWEGWNPTYILDVGYYERVCRDSSSSSSSQVGFTPLALGDENSSSSATPFLPLKGGKIVNNQAEDEVNLYYLKTQPPGTKPTGTQKCLRLIRDAFGTPLNSPSLLCDGRAIPAELRNEPCYREFTLYRWHDFVGVLA